MYMPLGEIAVCIVLYSPRTTKDRTGNHGGRAGLHVPWAWRQSGAVRGGVHATRMSSSARFTRPRRPQTSKITISTVAFTYAFPRPLSAFPLGSTAFLRNPGSGAAFRFSEIILERHRHISDGNSMTIFWGEMKFLEIINNYSLLLQ